MSDITSDDYKRGFILGMTMNPLMVTTEAAVSDTPATPQNTSGVIIADGVCGLHGLTILRTVIRCTDGTGGV